MAFTPALLTELEAVNSMLLSIGQSPVNTLESGTIVDVEIAKQALLDASRQVQEEGYEFNTDDAWVLTPDVNKNILISPEVLAVDPCNRYLRYVERVDPADSQRKLYDKDNHTFQIEEPVEVDITWFYAFDALPQPARNYISKVAGRKFQEGSVASQIVYSFNREDEELAKAQLNKRSNRNRDLNLLKPSRR